MIFLGGGITIGSILTAICTQYYNPFVLFFVGAFLTLIITFTAFMLTDDIETNKYAMILSDEDRLYLQHEQDVMDESNITAKKRNVVKYMCFKFKLVCKCLKEPTLMRVYTFMIL